MESADIEPPTRILAIRHGETAWNVTHRIQGQIDIGLNDMGRRQAARLATAMAGQGLSAVYSSDLRRAFDTARAIMQGAGRVGDPIAEPGLRERAFGVFEGYTPQEIDRHWPHDAARWRSRQPDFGAKGGETLQAFFDRCLQVASRLAAAHAGQTIALVTHGGVLDCLYRAATGTDLSAPRSWQVGNAVIHRLLHGAQGFLLTAWGDDTHLEGLAARDETDRASSDAPALS